MQSLGPCFFLYGFFLNRLSFLPYFPTLRSGYKSGTRYSEFSFISPSHVRSSLSLFKDEREKKTKTKKTPEMSTTVKSILKLVELGLLSMIISVYEIFFYDFYKKIV